MTPAGCGYVRCEPILCLRDLAHSLWIGSWVGEAAPAGATASAAGPDGDAGGAVAAANECSCW